MSRAVVGFCSSVVTLVAMTAVAACTVQQAGPSNADGGASSSSSSSSGSSGANTTPALSCLQILQCIVDCPDSDAACPDACVEKGTPDGKEKVTTFAQCIDTEKCTDAPCVQEKCQDSLTACTESSTPKSSGTPLNGDAPPGSIPADLVGSWAGANFGATERVIFNGDGTGSWQSAVASSSTGCFSHSSSTRTGTMVITDTTITVYATEVKTRVQECSPPAVEGTEPGRTEAIQYKRIDANTLSIIDNTCAAKYAGSDYSISFYCSSRITRE